MSDVVEQTHHLHNRPSRLSEPPSPLSCVRVEEEHTFEVAPCFSDWEGAT